MVKQKPGTSLQFASLVAQSYFQQIRHAEDQLEMKKNIIIELQRIAKDYGARSIGQTTQETTHIYTECCRLVLSRFSHFAINEIREAYRQWATNENPDKGAEMYHNDFNARQLGKVLAAYQKKRRPVIGLLLKHAGAVKEEKLREEKRNKARQVFKSNWNQAIEKAKIEAKSWRDIPVWWYDAMIKRKMINPTEFDQAIYFFRAESIGFREIESLKKERSMLSPQKRNQIVVPKLMTIASRIMKKLYVFENAIVELDTESEWYNNFSSFDQIPHWYYEWMIRHGLINPSEEEKREYFFKAKDFIDSEVERLKLEEVFGEPILEMRRQIVQTQIAKNLIIFEKVIEPLKSK